MPAKRQHRDRPESRVVWRLRRDLKYRAAPEYQRSARIAKSQAALQQRSRGAFFLPNDLKALLDELFIFACHLFFRCGCRLKFLMHFRVESGWALCRNEFHQAMNFIVRYEHTLRANKTRSARRQIQHVALPEQTIRSVL